MSNKNSDELRVTDHPNGSLYCQIMEQLKWRLDGVLVTLELVKNKKHYLRDLAAAELCLLQLRFCCELLALGCIAIHTDIAQSRRLRKEWNADLVIKQFEQLKPTFFPTPVAEQVDEAGKESIIAIDGGLKKKELLAMYRFCGKRLYIGNFDDLFAPDKKVFDFAILEDFISKLVGLLNTHAYYLHGDEILVRVIMNNKADGNVWLNTLHKRAPPDHWHLDTSPI